MGEKFKVKLVSGLRSLKYYDKKIEPDGILEVQTYGYLNENGEYVQNNGCAMNRKSFFRYLFTIKEFKKYVFD